MSRLPETLSLVEQEAVARIHAIRSSPDRDVRAVLHQRPERLMRDLIVTFNGHVKLRLRPLARELGIEIRTLERNFQKVFGITMLQCHTNVRLDVARSLLRAVPPMKLIAIAKMLGYEEERDFTRFFRKHLLQTPSQWRQAESGHH